MRRQVAIPDGVGVTNYPEFVAVSRMTARVGQVLGGRYRLLAPVGTGASASVYLADDVTLRRKVAVKVLHAALAEDESFLRRFRAEAQAAAGLNHPNVLVVYDWGEDDSVPFLVTEYLGGGSLRTMLDMGRTLTPAQALLVGLETARGLEYAHRRGFVHRDIKPANLLFDDDARLRIADFGLARALAEAAWTEPMGAVLGTAKYASPEQARGERLDGKSDVYSLGLVMIEAVTGAVPFAGDTTIGTLMARVDRHVDVPDSLNALGPLLALATDPDPAVRPDASAFGMALLDAAAGFDRPGPLPLAGARARDLATDESLVPTHGHGSDAIGEADTDITELGPLPPSEHDDITVIGPAQSAVVFGDDARAASPRVELGSTRRERKAAASLAKAEAHAEQVRARALERAARVEARASRRRRRWPWVVAATVLIVGALGAGGAYWWVELRLPHHPVPNLVGRDVSELDSLIGSYGWTLVRKDQFADGTHVGQILQQSPSPSSDVRQGESVSIIVSLGPSPVAVPTDLAGKKLDAASAALTNLGLGVGAIDKQWNEDLPDNTVMKIADGTPAQLPKGSTVNLVVSAGPEPRTIPDGLVGEPVEDATATLKGLGLTVATSDAFSDSITKGNVISVKPGVGQRAERGATVELVVSKGPENVAVPDVGGMSVIDAASAIEDAGLKVADTRGSPRRRVVVTDPAAGTLVKKGTKVTLITAD